MMAVQLPVPAEQIALLRELEWPRGLELEAEPLFDFVAEPVRALCLEHIFQPRMLAVCAVAKIAVHRHHGLRRVH